MVWRWWCSSCRSPGQPRISSTHCPWYEAQSSDDVKIITNVLSYYTSSPSLGNKMCRPHLPSHPKPTGLYRHYRARPHRRFSFSGTCCYCWFSGWGRMIRKKILERKEISVVGEFENPLERPLLVIPALPSPIIIMVVVAAYRSSSKLIPRMNGSLGGRHTAAAASVVCSNNDHHHPQGQQHPPTTITLVVLSPLFVAGWLAVQHHKQSVGCLWLGYFWHSQK